jgi:hypothetical protein
MVTELSEKIEWIKNRKEMQLAEKVGGKPPIGIIDPIHGPYFEANLELYNQTNQAYFKLLNLRKWLLETKEIIEPLRPLIIVMIFENVFMASSFMESRTLINHASLIAIQKKLEQTLNDIPIAIRATEQAIEIVNYQLNMHEIADLNRLSYFHVLILGIITATGQERVDETPHQIERLHHE